MKRNLFLLIFLLPFFGLAQSLPTKDSTGLQIKKLTGDFYIYTTWQVYGDTKFPSNSMYMVADTGVIMIDTPWDSTQFQPLLDSIEVRHHKKVILCIATHFHEDRTGGFAFLQSKGIPTWSSKLTYDWCLKRNVKQAQYYFEKDTTFTINQHTIQTYYPGPGHTSDNIVIWFNGEKLLYGGCFVKSNEAIDMGNTSDANVQEWTNSIYRVMRKFPRPAFIIPGHQNWLNRRALQHTLYLLNKYRQLFKTT